jgi:hypothetical protein
MYIMKRLFTIIILSFVAFFAFAQDAPPADDPYARFQGIWYVVVDDKYAFVIFIDDTFISAAGDRAVFFRYSVENQDLILTNAIGLSPDGWEESPDGIVTFKIQYVFSGDRLILAFEGEHITLSRIPEW